MKKTLLLLSLIVSLSARAQTVNTTGNQFINGFKRFNTGLFFGIDSNAQLPLGSDRASTRFGIVYDPATNPELPSSFTPTTYAFNDQGMITMVAYNSHAAEPRLTLCKARGTLTSPLSIQNGDILGRILFAPYNVSDYKHSVSIRSMMTGTTDNLYTNANLTFILRKNGNNAQFAEDTFLEFNPNGNIYLPQVPPDATGHNQFLTRNVSTGAIEKVSGTYFRKVDNEALDLNTPDLNLGGKLYGGTNAPIGHGQFFSFGQGVYSTQFNSQHTANGITYMRVNGDGGFGNWVKLYDSGHINDLKNDLGLATGAYQPVNTGGETLQSVAERGNTFLEANFTGETKGVLLGKSVAAGQCLSVGWNYNHGLTPYGEIATYAFGSPLVLQAGGLPESSAVLIGTTQSNGVDKLQVKGSITAKAVKVNPSAWPDYVFDLNYQFPSLKETKDFIRQNKHLPGIPSAKEVGDGGIELGDMNARLLKKIEELTLHLIEKDEEIKVISEKQKKTDERLQLILGMIDKSNNIK